MGETYQKNIGGYVTLEFPDAVDSKTGDEREHMTWELHEPLQLFYR